MKFIRKKNLLEGEELLFSPKLHWIYIIKPLLVTLPLLILFLILWTNSLHFISAFRFLPFSGIIFSSAYFIRDFILCFGLVLLLVLAFRIISCLCIEYGVTNKRLILKKGIIRTSVREIPVDRIESIQCYQSILGKICNYGKLSITGIGGTMPVFLMIHKPFSIRRKIADVIEKSKRITVVHGDLPRPYTETVPEIEEPSYLYGTFVKVTK